MHLHAAAVFLFAYAHYLTPTTLPYLLCQLMLLNAEHAADAVQPPSSQDCCIYLSHPNLGVALWVSAPSAAFIAV